MKPGGVGDLGRHDAWDGVHAVVLGLGSSGFAAADNLVHQGARVTVLDESDEGERGERATLLEILGAQVLLGPDASAGLPDDTAVVVACASSPVSATLGEAHERGIPVWGDVELAWRLRDLQHRTSWLVVAGDPGRGTTGRMLDYVLRAHGLRSVTCGDVGLPVVEAVMDPTPHDALVVTVTVPQLRHTRSMAPESSVVLGVADDLPAGYASFDDYLIDAGRAYEQVRRACVYNVADPRTEQLVRDADVEEGARAVGFTLDAPAVGMVGVVDGILADRAFVEERRTSAAELCTVADLAASDPPFVANALAAAALARAHGIPPVAVRNGLRAYEPPGGSDGTGSGTGA